MELSQWLEENHLCGEINSPFLTLNDKTYFIIEQSEQPLFNDKFEFILPSLFFETEIETEFVTFQFGRNWYWSSVEKPKLNILKYIGQSTVYSNDFPYIGIHGVAELGNGSGDYVEWCKKAKFLGVETLGICEDSTLAGVLRFQIACKDIGIKSIIGETVVVKDGENVYKLKLYCKNSVGWKNLLNINAQIKVFNDGWVNVEYIYEHSEGLICVIDSSTKLIPSMVKEWITLGFGEDIYYQFDPVEWANDTKETQHLELIRERVMNRVGIKPILICDSYYLDKADSHIRKLLNTVSQIGFQNQSSDQYFKTTGDVLAQCDELFKNDKKTNAFFDVLLKNTNAIGEQCNFEIKLKELHLPQYEMTKEEKKSYKTVDDLFWGLINAGMEEKIIGKVEDESTYWERVEKEVNVINKGGLRDYFLIIWDIINWCKKNDILTGFGRGCFIPTSKVLTQRGAIDIQDVIIGDYVINRYQKLDKVLDKFQYNVKEDLVELELENGKKIICTQDHEILTINRGYVKAKDLCIEDNLMELDEDLLVSLHYDKSR